MLINANRPKIVKKSIFMGIWFIAVFISPNVEESHAYLETFEITLKHY